MKFLTRLFSPDAASKAIDGITKGVDSAFFTEQEKKELSLEWLQALAPFKVVQRIMVGVIMTQWLLVGINYLAALWVEAVWPHIVVADRILEFAKTEFMWMPVVAAVGVYLGGGLMGKGKAGK